MNTPNVKHSMRLLRDMTMPHNLQEIMKSLDESIENSKAVINSNLDNTFNIIKQAQKSLQQGAQALEQPEKMEAPSSTDNSYNSTEAQPPSADQQASPQTAYSDEAMAEQLRQSMEEVNRSINLAMSTIQQGIQAQEQNVAQMAQTKGENITPPQVPQPGTE